MAHKKCIEKLIDLAYIASSLQNLADIEAINKLQIKLLESYWETHAKN